jgi:hypothetical protein
MAEKEKPVKERYIKIRVHNMERAIPEGINPDRSISVRDRRCRIIQIQDNSEVEVSEYVYWALKDAVEILYKPGEKRIGGDPSSDKPRKFIAYERPIVDIVDLTGFYYKAEDEVKDENDTKVIKTKVVKQKKMQKLVEAAAV